MDKKQLPSGSQKRVLRALQRCGVQLLDSKRGAGSHRVVRLNGKNSVVQAGDLSQGLVKTILEQLGIDPAEFIKHW